MHKLAYDSVKALLCSSSFLAALNMDVLFKLKVDASGIGAGAVLLQEDQKQSETSCLLFFSEI